MHDINRCNIAKFLVGLMIIFSSLMVFQIRGQTVFLLLQIVICAFMFFTTKKVVIQQDIILILISSNVIISMVLSLFSKMPFSYKKACIYMSILDLIIYFTASYVIYLIENDYLKKNFIKNCIKIMCILQLHWTVLQYVLFVGLGIDINKIIFVETLGMVENASAYKVGNYFMPSGFCWHPAVLVPIVVISFFMFKSWYVRLLAILVSFLCRNTTALICMMMCIAFSLLRQTIIVLKKRKFNQIIGLSLIVLIVVAAVVGYKTGVINSIFEKIVNIFERIFGLTNDFGSGDAHKRYYTSLPEVMDFSSIPQILFGYGMGCSGYPFSAMYNQYSNQASWAVESDIMNILYSRGIVGFVCYYGMLAYIAIKGYRINYKYILVIFIIALGGITYNIQFDWLFMINIFLLYFVNSNYDLFSTSEG